MKTCRMHALGVVAVACARRSGCSKTEGGSSGAPTRQCDRRPQRGADDRDHGDAAGRAASASASAASASARRVASAASASAQAGRLREARHDDRWRRPRPRPSGQGAPPATPLKPASTRVSGKNFTLDAASPGCRVDTPCTMTLRLAASGEYHVNKEYPYKFLAAAAPGVQFLGKR